MSIRVRINELAGRGKLRFHEPVLISQGVKRDVFLGLEVVDFLNGIGVDESFEKAIGRSQAKVDSFASGKFIVFGLNPDSKSPATMVARNRPVQKGVVDLRVGSYKPDVRIFGCFAQKDILILLTWAPKDRLHYATEVSRCRSRWDELFPEHTPLIGDTHDDYVSNFIAG